MSRASALMRLDGQQLPDWGELKNSTAQQGSSVPSTVSFDCRWSGMIERGKRRDASEKWGGDYIATRASIEWSASQDGFHFISDPRTTSKSSSGLIGRERNGVYFA